MQLSDAIAEDMRFPTNNIARVVESLKGSRLVNTLTHQYCGHLLMEPTFSLYFLYPRERNPFLLECLQCEQCFLSATLCETDIYS